MAASVPPFSWKQMKPDNLDHHTVRFYIGRVRKPILFLISGLVSTFADTTMAQSTARDYRLILRGENVLEKHVQLEERSPVGARSELGIAGSGLIRLYQILISSQDSPACNFTPSCSRFTAAAIRKAGLIRGTLLGADRLSRCHRWTKRQYLKTHNLSVDQLPLHIYDPPERYIDVH
jgi:putative component of membrane protein insertase Oxa1/YidC/SpoIIIJ protein YidD